MNPFQRASIPEAEIQKAVRDVLLMFTEQPAVIVKQLGLPPGSTVVDVSGAAYALVKEHNRNSEQWRNDTYQVCVRPFDDAVIHLSIKRNDRQPIHDWRDLQEIKNQLIGPEHEAVELYPAESRKADSANQYHLWVLSDPKQRFPFGFGERFVFDEIKGSASKQRPL